MPIAPPAWSRIRAPDEGVDQQDVPAAVVCAHCGFADCPGCADYEDDAARSGVVAIVPWEREGNPFWRRLWSTSRATVFEPEQFFGLLPDGPVGKPVAFAITSELLAVGAMAAAGALLLLALFPGWSMAVVTHSPLRVLRLFSGMVPATAAILVFAHGAHGLALDVGARSAGATPHTRRALRFGLYAAGWDLTIGPLGASAELFRGGARAALRLASGVEARGLPTRCTVAFVRQTYNLAGESAKRPMMAALVVAVTATILGACGLIVLAFVLWFWG